VNQRVFRGAAWCVPWSTWAAESLAADYHVSATQIAVIPPGVDMKAWRMARPTSVSRTANLRVLFVGADLHRKGGEVLLAAFNALGDHVELDIVTRSDVVASDRVRVHRALRPNDVQLLDLYRSADVFVLPSLSETFGIAAIEASAAGLPVIASKIGGLTDIVRDGVSGYLLEPGDVSALAAALRRLGSDPLLRVRMGAQARKHALQRFDADTNARRLLDLVRACAVSEVPE
jgi:glycosyltransferase involved in cell wall biosynthesis